MSRLAPALGTALAVALVSLSGCAVSYPIGWTRRAEASEIVSATPGVMYGNAPRSWDVPGGDRILVDVENASVSSGLGFYHADIRFSAAYASAPSARLFCRTQPGGPGVPPTRFGCWTQSAGDELLSFWMAPGEDCPVENFAVLRTLTTPTCWNGILTVAGRRIRLEHGHLESTGSPVGYVSWVDERDQMLLAADIVREMQVALSDPSDARPVAAPLRKQLVLLTVALSWWEHAASPRWSVAVPVRSAEMQRDLGHGKARRSTDGGYPIPAGAAESDAMARLGSARCAAPPIANT